MTLAELAAVTWNLADLYETDDAAREAMRHLASDVETFARFTADFGSSATALADALDARAHLQRQLQRILAYARLRTSDDARDARAQVLLHEATQLAADVREASAFVEPTLVGIGADTIAAFVRAESRLAVYAVYLEDLAQRADRVLSERDERLLAAARGVAKSAYGAYHALVNVELPYPEIVLSDGRRTRIDPITYAELRAARDPVDREAVSTTFFSALGAYARTCGALMNASVQRARFEAACRGYASAFELALAEFQVPDTLYRTLITAVNAHLPVLHRYLTVRQRLLGLRHFHYHDLHAPLAPSDAHEYSLEQACQLVVTAMAPLGPAYVATLRRALNERWVDFLPRGGKPSGAFTTGAAYDVHPYASLNFHGTWQDVSTLAHECGHVLHAAYTNATQPFPLAALHPLVGELAATFNEGMLIRHMLDAPVDDIPPRIVLLDGFLERIRTTVFRQVCFGEFELRMYAMAQNRAAITGESLSREYLALLRRYCGHDAGICLVDDQAGYEWIDIPHLRGMFSVLNYPVSFVASFVLADRVHDGDTAARDAYLDLLAAGSSRRPLQLLTDAGVDVQDPALLDHVFARMHARTTELERLA